MQEYGQGAMYQHSGEPVRSCLEESGFKKLESKGFYQDLCTLYIATK